MLKSLVKFSVVATVSSLLAGFSAAQSGIGYYVDVQNPSAYLQAIAAYSNSSAASSANITTTVQVAVANGMGSATHFVNQNGASLGDIDRLRAASMGTPEFAEFQSAVQGNRSLAGELVYNSLGVDNGKADAITSSNPYHWHIHLLVTDLPAYLDALEDLMDANDGDVLIAVYQTAGTGLGGGNLVVVNTANTLEELLTNNNGYDEFIEKTIDIRTPIANGIYQTVATFN
tara:strand:- start:3 stop:692 length:690 start_codon:yes stop_codon:yes gene_type:complete